MAAGGIAMALGTWIAPERIGSAALLTGFYVIGLALAGLFFMSLQILVNARWSFAIRRVPDAMAAAMPWAAGAMAGILLASPWIYPWVGDHHLHGFKHFWLDLPFFLGRCALYLVAWIAFSRALLCASREGGDSPVRTPLQLRLSAFFMPVFAVTLCLASFDWIMSLEPHWYSTIFGVYHFAGMFSGGLAALIALAVYLHRLGPLRGVLTADHLHDLGKLLFGFTTFWMYIWFSQYMLIWYSNIPEETVYFIRRQQGAWAPLLVLNIVLNWGIPFVALLVQRIKFDMGVMGKIAAVVLVGRWLDLYLMIFPAGDHTPVPGLLELGAAAVGAGFFLLLFFRTFFSDSHKKLS